MKSFDNNTFCNNHQKSSSSSSMNKTSSTSIKHRHHPNHPQKYEQQHQQQEHSPPPSPSRQFSNHPSSPLLCHNNTHYLDNASGNNICSPNNRHFPNSNTASLPIRLSTPSSPSKKRRRNNHTLSMQNHLLCFKKSKWNLKYMRNLFCIFSLSAIFGVQVWFQRLALIQNNDEILKVSSRNMILESSSSSVVSLSLDKSKSMSNDDVASSISSIQGRSKLQSKQNLRYEFQTLDKSETFNTVHKMLKDLSLLKRMKPLSISLPPISTQFNIPANSSSIIDRYEISNSNYERKNDVKSVSIGSSRQTDQRSDCKSVHRWHTSNYPTCNDVHGVGGDLLSSFVHLLSAGGSWRMAWRIDNGSYAPEIKDDDFAYESLRGINDTSWNLDEYNSPKENVVLKMLKVSQDPDFETYERHRKDAVAMEVLTSSDNIIDIYGFCGNSVLTEMAVGDAAILLKQKSLHTLDRLKIARDLAKAIDEVHRPRVISNDPYFSSTAIAMVHNDVNPSNVVAVRGGRLKINDFNLVEFIQQNETSHEECGFPIMFSNPLVCKIISFTLDITYFLSASFICSGEHQKKYEILLVHWPHQR